MVIAIWPNTINFQLAVGWGVRWTPLGGEGGQGLLAPTGALVLMMVYYISAAAAATFSDFEHLCLSILLQVSLYVA